MDQNTNTRAWLYQYNSAGGATWLSDLAAGRQIAWRIVRRFRETHPGDFVVFWEAGAKGGLRGWGQIQDALYVERMPGNKNDRWRVPLKALSWLETPIPREAVKSANPFGPDNTFFRSSRGANFPLAPDEFRNLLTLMGVNPKSVDTFSNGVQPHKEIEPRSPEQIAESESESESEAEAEPILQSDIEEPELPGGFNPHELTTAALQILYSADYRNQKIAGPVSTTRLFLSVFDPRKWESVERGNPPETTALRVLREAVVKYASPLSELRSMYMAEQKEGSERRLSVTDNAKRLLEIAFNSEFTELAGGLLSADGIIAALLTVESGVVLDRLPPADLNLGEMREFFIDRVSALQPSLKPVWRRAFTGLRSGSIEGDDDIGVAILGNDNAWNKDVQDSLGAKREAEAFAALSVSTRFVPPLAVGVFGEWGSGKSFFMRLVHDRIKTLSDQAEGGDQATVLANVVQIRFNAWHYVESNLWASLVDHIFAELDKATSELSEDDADKFFRQLTTARELMIASAELLIERRREQAQAAMFVASAEKRLIEKKLGAANLLAVHWRGVMTLFRSQLDNDKALASHAKLLGIDGLIADGTQFGDALRQLDDSRREANLVVSSLRSNLLTLKSLAIFSVVTLASAAILYGTRDWIASILAMPELAKTLQGWVLGASGILIAATSVVGKTIYRVKRAVAFLKSAKAKFDKAAEDGLKTPMSELKQQQDELARLQAEVAEGQARLAASTEKVSEAAREYNAKNGRGRLLSFVRSRAAGEAYAKHLGLVSTVRKDFEELSDLMTASDSDREQDVAQEKAAYEARVKALLARATLSVDGDKATAHANVGIEGPVDSPQESEPLEIIELLHEDEIKKLKLSIDPERPAPTVSRIVLYIDDLDRCQPQTVVEVLQAVHLLLSFRLFIVFVAVDVRWVTAALKKCYPELLSESAGAGGATAHDYLEKIFQVPYWVRDMSPTGSTKFMTDRLLLQKTSRAKPRTPPARATGATNVGIPVVTGTPATDKTSAPVPKVETVTQLAAPPAPPANVPPRTITSPSSPEDELAHNAPAKGSQPANADANSATQGISSSSSASNLAANVELSDAEGEYMTMLAPWAGNSPRRLIRFMNIYQVMKASLSRGDAFSAKGGEFLELMTQVAIITGAPDISGAWHRHLAQAGDDVSVENLRKQVSQWTTTPDQVKNLAGALQAFQSQRATPDAPHLRRYAEFSRRFSFGHESDTATLATSP